MRSRISWDIEFCLIRLESIGDNLEYWGNCYRRTGDDWEKRQVERNLHQQREWMDRLERFGQLQKG